MNNDFRSIFFNTGIIGLSQVILIIGQTFKSVGVKQFTPFQLKI